MSTSNADCGLTRSQGAPEDLESVWEAARVVGVAPSTVHGWIKSGWLTALPGPGVRRVSVAAAQALMAPPDPAIPADAVAIYEALRLTDVSRRTIVAWVKKGWLPSWPGRYGMLVRVADVRAVAQQRRALDSATGAAALLPPDSLPIREAALQAGVSRVSIYNWGRQGPLSVWPGTESGQRVSQADVVATAQRPERALPRRPAKTAVTSQQQRPEPPRRPLRVHVSVRGQLGDGSAIVATAWRTLAPHEPEYELAYQEAARAYRISGWEMPYADAGDEDEEEAR